MNKPTILVQLSTRERVDSFRRDFVDGTSLVAVGMEAAAFSTLPGLDALYMSLTRAERWGSRPIPPHTVSVLETRSVEQQEGWPRYILSGLVLRDADRDEADFVVPILVQALLAAVETVNLRQSRTIRTIGLFETELRFGGNDRLAETGRLLSTALKDSG